MEAQKTIKTGEKHQMEFVVEELHTAAHLGSGMVKVLATPTMILFMEITARTMLDELLPEGYSTVGTRVDVRHLAPAALGRTVRAEVAVDAVDGDKVTLSVAVWDGEALVGQGAHERYVIEVERFLRKLRG